MRDLLERVLFGVFLLVHLVILFGITAKGLVDFTKGYFLADKVVGTLFIVVGLLFSAIVARYARALVAPEWKSPILTWWRKKKFQVVASGIVFLALILVRTSWDVTLPYLGLLAGGFVTDQARIGWLRLFRIDLAIIGFYHLVWLFQWYYIDTIVGWVLRIARRLNLRT